jgi:cystathionine beta-lyase/cystathionine gamma-synthase
LSHKFNIETTIMDTGDPEAVRSSMRPNTKLVHIEPPGNLTLAVSDIWTIAGIAHDREALFSVDNTLASPYIQRLLELGADFSVESLTKYINGHGNAKGGVLVFGLNADHDPHNRFVSNLWLITSAVSLGRNESLIVFLGEKDERQYLFPLNSMGGSVSA